MNAVARIDIRIDNETKLLLERASAVSGLTVTQYITSLIRQNAPITLANAANIQLNNEQFDNFIEACAKAEKLSDKILKTARCLDEKGY